MTSLSQIISSRAIPADGDPVNVLPRNVWRHLVATAALGLKSRVLVVGDAAELAASFFRGLGCDATSADEQKWELSADYDAVIRFEILTPAERTPSLLGTESLQRTAELLQRVAPCGLLQFVCLVGNDGSAHSVACVENHLKALGEQPQIAVFPVRSFGKLFRGAGRSFAVASCRTAERNREAPPHVFAAGNHHDDSCCRWADRSRAA